MIDGAGTVFLLDVDNTLLDHDALKHNVSEWIGNRPEGVDPALFWTLYERVRRTMGIVDFMETARQFGDATGSERLGLEMRSFLWEFPFGDFAFPQVKDTVLGLKDLGQVVIVCDGHEPFQRRKASVLGLTPHLDGLFVFDHKELHLHVVMEQFPARHYVLIDDKPRIHDVLKRTLGPRITTVQVEHGHYAIDPDAELLPADYRIKSFNEVLGLPYLTSARR